MAARVIGSANPLNEKPGPLVDAHEIVTVDPLVFIKVWDLVLFLPTGTPPKARLVGLEVSVP